MKCSFNMASVKFETFFRRSSPRDIMKSGRGLEKLSSTVFSNSPFAQTFNPGDKMEEELISFAFHCSEKGLFCIKDNSSYQRQVYNLREMEFVKGSA